jgi:hypothetical protein
MFKLNRDVNMIEELEYVFMILSNLFKNIPMDKLITVMRKENGL